MKKITYCFLFVIIIFSSCQKYESTSNSDNLKTKYVVAKNGLRLRDKPSLNSKVITTLPYSSELQIIKKEEKTNVISGKKGNWVKVKSNNFTGWVFDGFLSKEMNSNNQKYAQYHCTIIHSEKPKYKYFSWTLDFDDKKKSELHLISADYEIWDSPSNKKLDVEAINLPLWTINDGFVEILSRKENNIIYVLKIKIKHFNEFEEYRGKIKIDGYHYEYKNDFASKNLIKKIKINSFGYPSQL